MWTSAAHRERDDESVRNIAAYRQKAGRVGRETGMDALNVGILTESPLDLHYYRQPRKLVAETA